MSEEQLRQIRYGEHQEDVVDIIEQSLSRKIDVLKKEIADLYTDIRNRNGLHRDITGELDNLIENRHAQLSFFPKGSGSWGGYFESNVAELEKEIGDLKREKRLEKVGCWKNKTELKKQLRELLKEYESLMKRKEFLKECLGGVKNCS